MIKFKIFTKLTVLFICAQFSYAGDCGGVDVEQAFRENKLVIFADVISTKLTRDQFVRHYLSKRKGLNGFNKSVHLEQAKQAWSEYEKIENFTHLLVKGVLKGAIDSDGIIKTINTFDAQFQIGKTYILFLSKPYKDKNLYIVDSCIYFNFTDKKYIQGDRYFSKPGMFEGALDELMLYSDAHKTQLPRKAHPHP